MVRAGGIHNQNVLTVNCYVVFGGGGGYLRSIYMGRTEKHRATCRCSREDAAGPSDSQCRSEVYGEPIETQMVSLYFSRDASLRNYVLNLECATSPINVNYVASASAEGVGTVLMEHKLPRQVNLAQSLATTDAVSRRCLFPGWRRRPRPAIIQLLSVCSATEQLARGLNIAFLPKSRIRWIAYECSLLCPHRRSQSKCSKMFVDKHHTARRRWL